jgi:hypothetical protein
LGEHQGSLKEGSRPIEWHECLLLTRQLFSCLHIYIVYDATRIQSEQRNRTREILACWSTVHVLLMYCFRFLTHETFARRRVCGSDITVIPWRSRLCFLALFSVS